MDLTLIDVSDNTYRYYRMEIMPGLFGDWSLVREWGRIGLPGQADPAPFPDEGPVSEEARHDLHPVVAIGVVRDIDQRQVHPYPHIRVAISCSSLPTALA